MESTILSEKAICFKRCGLNRLSRPDVREKGGRKRWLDAFLIVKSQNDPCFTCEFLNVAVDLHFVPPLSRLPNLDRLLAPEAVIMV